MALISITRSSGQFKDKNTCMQSVKTAIGYSTVKQGAFEVQIHSLKFSINPSMSVNVEVVCMNNAQ